MSENPRSALGAGLRRNLFLRNPFLRMLSSIWFGVSVLALILVYSSVVSAFAPVRWELELTEMQAFRHGLFVGLVALFMLSLVLTTLLRLRWTPVHMGALAAHVGLLLLALGALLYFGSKVEGDVLLESPAIEVRSTAAGGRIIDRFRAAKDELWGRIVPAVGGPVRVLVRDTVSSGVQPVSAAQLAVAVGDGEPRLLTLTARPDDRQKIHDTLELRLVASPPRTHFYDDELPVLYITNPASGTAVTKVIEHLPIYRERYQPEGSVLTDARGVPYPSRRTQPKVRLGPLAIPTGWLERWRMPIDVDTGDLPFTIRIIGYLPCVQSLRPKVAADGGMDAEPVLQVREMRRADAGPRSTSAIRMEISGRGSAAGWSVRRWCLFSAHPEVEPRPVQVQVPGTPGAWQIAYSRARYDLGATLGLRKAWVTYFPGQRGVESFHSDLLVQAGGAGAVPVQVSTNRTYTVGPWTLYQSGFDGEEHWTYTILGVGNRRGMWLMNIGWIITTLGCLYAFYIKPVLVRRLKNGGAAATRATSQADARSQPALAGAARIVALLLVLLPIGAARANQNPERSDAPPPSGTDASRDESTSSPLSEPRRPDEPLAESQNAIALDAKIDWTQGRLIVIQDSGRYKALDSFARESFAAMTGREHLPGLSPLASLLEWVFNSAAYEDAPVIKVKEPGLRARLTAHLGAERQAATAKNKYFTPRELADPAVDAVLADMETQPLMRRAANRVRTAQAFAERLDDLIAIVPRPGGDRVTAWVTPQQLVGNFTDEQLAQLGITRAALPLELQRGVAGITPDQALAVALPWTSLRGAWLRGDAAEVQKYLDQLAAVLPTLAPPGVYPERSQRAAEVTYYARGKFTFGWLVYFIGMIFSIWALVTRWRTPWLITFGLTLAAWAWHAYGVGLRWSILGRIPVGNMFEAVTGAACLGIAVVLVIEAFLRTRILLVGASALGFFALVVAGYVLPGSELSTIPAILDHVQLRIHTVLISSSYVLIFLAAVIGLVYLLGFYGHWLRTHVRRNAAGSQLVSLPQGTVDGAALARAGNELRLASASASTARCPRCGGGLRLPGPYCPTCGAPGEATAPADPLPLVVSRERPLLAGALPGDEGRDLPQWLNNMDWTHLIILNLVFVMLFVGGIVMGAMWADVSWGRPWGWDPKEVFALNTWIIYAILIHVRFVVKRRGLWTAWLSLAGCAMMAFNWFFVNFYIASIHSYA